MTESSRRDLIRGVLGLTLVSSSYVLMARSAESSRRLEDALVECLVDRESAAALGTHYLSTSEAKNWNRNDLCREILETSAMRDIFLSAPDDVRQTIIRRHVRDDFLNGRTIEVDGWVLSKTETLLFALASRV